MPTARALAFAALLACALRSHADSPAQPLPDPASHAEQTAPRPTAEAVPAAGAPAVDAPTAAQPKAAGPNAAELAPGVLPEPVPFTKYEPILQRPLFGAATAKPTEGPTPGFAQDIFVSGVARIGSREFVSLASRSDPNKRITLESGKDGPEGMRLAKIEWSRETGKSRALLQKGPEFASIEFDQATISAPPPPPPQATPQPLTPPAPQAQIIPGAPVPDPGGTPMVRRPRRIRLPPPAPPAPSAPK